MTKRDPSWLVAALAALVALGNSNALDLYCAPAGAAEKTKKKPAKYVRVVQENGQPTAMETAIVTYQPAGEKDKGVVVELVGAVHIGDKAYYERLNKLFETYDVLLYELVAPPNVRIPKGGRKGAPRSVIGFMQRGMKDMLKLEFQLEQVDYTKKNFVHADMSPEEFAKSMKDRGESWLGMFFKMMGRTMAEQAAAGNGQASDLDVLAALFSRNRHVKLKRIMAVQLQNMDGALDVLSGEAGSTIITERNKKALAVLKKQLKAGKKKIGIFYGAAHLPDFHERLVKDFKMRPTKTRWVTAWDLKMPAPAGR